MKKTIFSIMFAMILGCFAVSCGNKAADATLGTGVDSTLVDSTLVISADTLAAADTLAVIDSVCAE